MISKPEMPMNIIWLQDFARGNADLPSGLEQI